MKAAVLVAIGLWLCGCAEIIVASAVSDARRSARAEQARRETLAREQHDRIIIAQGRALTKAAVEAARTGDCAKVGLIKHQILALPTVRLEGGIHDTIFLREPEIVKCIAEQRLAYDVCSAQRDRQFAAASTDAAKRMQLLRAIPSCVASTTADVMRERAWGFTIVAATNAASGNCDSAVKLDPQVRDLDRTHHQTTFVREPGIDQCLRAVIIYRVHHQRCVQERAAAMRRISEIWDPTARAKALALLRECPPVK